MSCYNPLEIVNFFVCFVVSEQAIKQDQSVSFVSLSVGDICSISSVFRFCPS